MDAGTPDGLLLELARQGDHAAFRELVVRYESTVASAVIGMLGPGDDADDVGQETFIRFHAALDRFRGEAALATYLRRIALNLSLNALKRRRRNALRFVSRDQEPRALPEPEMEVPHPDAVEQRAAVRKAIEQLGPRHRPVVVLRMMDGLTTRETAEVLGLPDGTVMSRLARAMVELKRLLAPHLREEPDGS